LPDVERTCDQVVVLARGRVIESGTIAALTRSEERFVGVNVAGDVAAFEAGLTARGHVFQRSATGELRIATHGEDADGLFALAATCGARIEGVEELRTSLEDVFLRALRSAEGTRP